MRNLLTVDINEDRELSVTYNQDCKDIRFDHESLNMFLNDIAKNLLGITNLIYVSLNEETHVLSLSSSYEFSNVSNYSKIKVLDSLIKELTEYKLYLVGKTSSFDLVN